MNIKQTNHNCQPVKILQPKMNNDENQKPDVIHKINDNIMKFKYFPDLDTAAGVHIGLNSFYMQMRQEVHNLHNIHLQARRQKMRELLIEDFLQEKRELEEVDIGYINTQP